MRSIELNWLWRKNKWVILPELKFVTSGSFDNSCYLTPGSLILDKLENEHYASRGLIIINTDAIENIDSLIAHEWTHHMQYHSGTDFAELDTSLDYDALLNDYDNFIAEYYARQHERDALMSECKLTNDEISKYHWFLTTGQTWKNTIK